MSGGLAPSRSTVYISNIPFDLKTNDLHQLFGKYGRIIKVTILKDKETRKSKGVAFILFLNVEDALQCVKEINDQIVFGRTLKASIAKDNGRTTEFIRRKDYPDKSRCYECGEFGHLSYKCNKNLLGERDPPPKKNRKRKIKEIQVENHALSEEDEEEVEDYETLSAAIALEYEKQNMTGQLNADSNSSNLKTKRIKKSSYFSDEEESD